MGMVVREFFFGMIAWMAEEESRKRSERVLDSEKFQKAVQKGKVGRAGIPESAKQQVIEYLKQGKSYSWIQKHVTYKVKYGKVRHVSPATISNIKKSSFKKGDGFE